MSMHHIVGLILAVVSAASKSPNHGKNASAAPDTAAAYDVVERLKESFTTLDADWSKGESGEYRVVNNVWNKKGVRRYRQSVGIRPLPGGTVEAGWAWEWPDKNRAIAFPELVFGRNPWGTESSTTKLPTRISDLDSLSVEFEFEHEGDGKRGTALQLWFTSDSAAGEQGIRNEIMIWLTNDGIPVTGVMADVSIGGTQYELSDEANLDKPLEWGFYSFFRKAPIRNGQIDLLPFVRFLVSKKLMGPSEYLAAIHLGNEVRGGVGITLVHRYRVVVERR